MGLACIAAEESLVGQIRSAISAPLLPMCPHVPCSTTVPVRMGRCHEGEALGTLADGRRHWEGTATFRTMRVDRVNRQTSLLHCLTIFCYSPRQPWLDVKKNVHLVFPSVKIYPKRQESRPQVTSAEPGTPSIHAGFVGANGILNPAGFKAWEQASRVEPRTCPLRV